MIFQKTLIAIWIAACCAFSAIPANAGEFVCTPDAIHAKAQYVLGVWAWLNSSQSDNAAADVLQNKLHKVWDGRGDCNGNEDMTHFSARTQIEILKIHFYGDMMSVAFGIGAKDYKTARQHMNDWYEAEKLISSNRGGMDDALLADESRNKAQMLGFDAKLKKLGY